MRECPQKNELWKHFKGDLYEVLEVAMHTETEELLVVYRCIKTKDVSKKEQLYARPLALFLSEVDHEKYPEVTQRYRFERSIKDEQMRESFETEVYPLVECYAQYLVSFKAFLPNATIDVFDLDVLEQTIQNQKETYPNLQYHQLNLAYLNQVKQRYQKWLSE